MKLLAFAYACEPDKGSEPGAGWNWVRMLASLGETWVITRANNRDAIEEALPSIPERARLRFIYVDLARKAMFWKKGQRGVRLYYLLWQVRALREAKRLHARENFDVVWHLTMANAWLGSVGGLVGTQFVYGPVGGGVRFPWRLVGAVGFRGALYEVVRSAAQDAGRYLNPLSRSAWRRAELILVQNPETKVWLPRRHWAKVIVFPNAVLDELPTTPSEERESHTAMFVGRLVPWKGASLAIEAIARTEDWRLWICGSGHDEGRLRRIAKRLGVEGRVRFLGQLPRHEVLARMRRAEVFLFPSLHDEAGLVVLEAQRAGLPVICCAIGGPPILAPEIQAVQMTSRFEVVSKLSSQLPVAHQGAKSEVSWASRFGRLSVLHRLMKDDLVPRVIQESAARRRLT